MRPAASPTERTTAATDALLSLAAAGGIVLLQPSGTPPSWKIQLWSWAFAFIALSAALGAVHHGIALSARRRTLLWRILTACLSAAISLVAVGVVILVLLLGLLGTTWFAAVARQNAIIAQKNASVRMRNLHPR